MYKEFEMDLDRSLKAAAFLDELDAFDFDSCDDFSSLVRRAEEIAEDAMPSQVRSKWERWIASARFIQSEQELSSALINNSGIADAKAAKEIRLEQLKVLLTCENESGHPKEAFNIDSAKELLSIPLPNLYWHLDHRWDEMRERRTQVGLKQVEIDPLESLPEVVRIGVFIDECPIVAPQEISPAKIYSLKIVSRFSMLPESVKGIQFEFLSTLAPDQLSIGKCEVAMSAADLASEQDIVAESSIVFPFEQNDPFRKVVVATSAYLVTDEKRVPVRVIGHDQLQFRVRSENRTLLSSGFPRMDAHLHDLLQKLIDERPELKDELQELLPVFDALVAVQATFAQGADFKYKSSGTIGEDEFQRETLKCLRMRLGEDVQEGTQQAGGITDIRYRGVVIELKVEGKLTDRRIIAAKYGQQATQYAGVEARSISIVLCLDISDKTRTQGDIRNDVIVEKIETNEDSPDRESCVFLFMVRANQRSPSSYSR